MDSNDAVDTVDGVDAVAAIDAVAAVEALNAVEAVEAVDVVDAVDLGHSKSVAAVGKTPPKPVLPETLALNSKLADVAFETVAMRPFPALQLYIYICIYIHIYIYISLQLGFKDSARIFEAETSGDLDLIRAFVGCVLLCSCIDFCRSLFASFVLSVFPPLVLFFLFSMSVSLSELWCSPIAALLIPTFFGPHARD